MNSVLLSWLEFNDEILAETGMKNDQGNDKLKFYVILQLAQTFHKLYISKSYLRLKAESQDFLDPVLINLSLSIKLDFKNTDLG